MKNHIFTTVWSGNGEILPGSGHSYLRKDVSGKTNWSFEDLRKCLAPKAAMGYDQMQISPLLVVNSGRKKEGHVVNYISYKNN
jgi:hypothetical protein